MPAQKRLKRYKNELVWNGPKSMNPVRVSWFYSNLYNRKAQQTWFTRGFTFGFGDPIRQHPLKQYWHYHTHEGHWKRRTRCK